MLRYIIPLLALPLCSLFAESSVWRVAKDGQSFYLGGTCYALRPSDYPLPAEFELAYLLSDTVVFEMDPSLANDPNFTVEILKAASYTGKRDLKNILSKKHYKALAEKCEQSGFSIEVLRKTKPSMVIMMLMVKELDRFGVTEEGVDIYFHRRALKDKKEVLALETAEFQIDLISSLGEGIENKMIAYGLKDIENLQENFDPLVASWRKGDLKAINKNFVSGIRDYPKLYKKVLTKRNRAWLNYLEEIMLTPETEFVLVGAAHMAGKKGLIALLKEKGYTIEQIGISF